MSKPKPDPVAARVEEILEQTPALVDPKALERCLCGCDEVDPAMLVEEIGAPGAPGHAARLEAWRAACKARCIEVWGK